MEVAPEIWARAAARALTGPFSCTSNRADSLKYSIAVSGTESRHLSNQRKKKPILY